MKTTFVNQFSEKGSCFHQNLALIKGVHVYLNKTKQDINQIKGKYYKLFLYIECWVEQWNGTSYSIVIYVLFVELRFVDNKLDRRRWMTACQLSLNLMKMGGIYGRGSMKGEKVLHCQQL